MAWGGRGEVAWGWVGEVRWPGVGGVRWPGVGGVRIFLTSQPITDTFKLDRKS